MLLQNSSRRDPNEKMNHGNFCLISAFLLLQPAFPKHLLQDARHTLLLLVYWWMLVYSCSSFKHHGEWVGSIPVRIFLALTSYCAVRYVYLQCYISKSDWVESTSIPALPTKLV